MYRIMVKPILTVLYIEFPIPWLLLRGPELSDLTSVPHTQPSRLETSLRSVAKHYHTRSETLAHFCET